MATERYSNEEMMERFGPDVEKGGKMTSHDVRYTPNDPEYRNRPANRPVRIAVATPQLGDDVSMRAGNTERYLKPRANYNPPETSGPNEQWDRANKWAQRQGATHVVDSEYLGSPFKAARTSTKIPNPLPTESNTRIRPKPTRRSTAPSVESAAPGLSSINADRISGGANTTSYHPVRHQAGRGADTARPVDRSMRPHDIRDNAVPFQSTHGQYTQNSLQMRIKSLISKLDRTS
jgi:hypothetical protein